MNEMKEEREEVVRDSDSLRAGGENFPDGWIYGLSVSSVW